MTDQNFEEKSREFVEEVLKIIDKFAIDLPPKSVSYNLMSISLGLIYTHADHEDIAEEFSQSIFLEICKLYKEKNNVNSVE